MSRVSYIVARVLAAMSLYGSFVQAQDAAPDSTVPIEYRSAAINAGVPYTVLYALALQESNNPHHEDYSPWPWTLNVSGKPFYMDSKEEAVAMLKSALAKGIKNIDICAGQVNYLWNGHLIPSIDKAFDLDSCLKAATDVLVSEFEYCEHRMGVLDWWCAVKRYHSPGTNKAQRLRAEQYAMKVKAIHQRLFDE